jgi:hypothetical protein
MNIPRPPRHAVDVYRHFNTGNNAVKNESHRFFLLDLTCLFTLFTKDYNKIKYFYVCAHW